MAADSGSADRPRSATPAVGKRLTLNLGVLVQYYRNGGKTTADVARILEEKYGIFAAHFEHRGHIYGHAFETSLDGALEALLMGKAVDPFARAMDIIERDFREFISSQGVERVGIPGVPTKAALMGVSHRRKHPYARSNPRRPSFRDTGTYSSSYRAWVT